MALPSALAAACLMKLSSHMYNSSNEVLFGKAFAIAAVPDDAMLLLTMLAVSGF